jgi:hypothetical protein
MQDKHIYIIWKIIIITIIIIPLTQTNVIAEKWGK